YLQLHIKQQGQQEECRTTLGRLGRYTSGTLTPTQRRQVDDHVGDCAKCSLVLAELGEVGGSMRLVLGPLVLGSAVAAAGYFAVEESAKAAFLAAIPFAHDGGASAVTGATGASAAG